MGWVWRTIKEPQCHANQTGRARQVSVGTVGDVFVQGMRLMSLTQMPMASPAMQIKLSETVRRREFGTDIEVWISGANEVTKRYPLRTAKPSTLATQGVPRSVEVGDIWILLGQSTAREAGRQEREKPRQHADYERMHNRHNKAAQNENHPARDAGWVRTLTGGAFGRQTKAVQRKSMGWGRGMA